MQNGFLIVLRSADPDLNDKRWPRRVVEVSERSHGGWGRRRQRGRVEAVGRIVPPELWRRYCAALQKPGLFPALFDTNQRVLLPGLIAAGAVRNHNLIGFRWC